jgi:epoxyqueuosine reductase
LPPAEGNWTGTVQGLAREAGLDLVGIVPLAPPATLERYDQWLAAGHHGEMAYLARADAVERRRDPARILPGARTAVAVGLNYHTLPLPPELRDDPSRGIVASYAWGPDYHDVMLPRLHRLAAALAQATGRPIPYRAYVDTGPVLERDLAARAGLGFVGKNTNLIRPHLGSWFFLGELLLADELEPLEVLPARGTCGRCTRCLDACPTAAFTAAYVLDARRCISYLTIELKGPIPHELRPLMGNRIFGCDVCQEVCPWNRRFARPARETAFRPDPDVVAPRLLDLLALDDEGFRRRFAGSPVKRARRRGLLRNAAVAAGNWGDPAAVPVLAALLDDHEALIRGHAAWALGRAATPAARRALDGHRPLEADGWVRSEIEAALDHGDS